MLDNESWDEVADLLGGDDFSRDDHRLIFGAIRELITGEKHCDNLTVCEHLRSREKLDDAGGPGYVGNLLIGTPSAANVETYARIVRDMSILRQLAIAGRRITGRVLKTGGREAEELLEEAEQEIFRINEQSYKGDLEELGMSEAFRTELVNWLRERERSGEAVTGVATGLTDFDNLTAGLQNGDLVILAGRPSLGKTSLALTIAQSAVLSQKPVSALLFSLEMPKKQIALRLLSSLGEIDHADLRIGRIGRNWSKVNSALNMLKEAPLLIDDSQLLTPDRIRSRARRVSRAEDRAGRKLGLILVDYLQLIDASASERRDMNRATELGAISKSLKALARELDVPVVVLSQLNREVERRPDRRVQLSDLRDSGAIEQDADVVAFVTLPGSPDKQDVFQVNKRVLHVAKQRNGPTGDCEVYFESACMRFRDITARRRLRRTAAGSRRRLLNPGEEGVPALPRRGARNQHDSQQGAGGVVRKRPACIRAIENFAVREGQQEMALAVARTLADGGCLIAEAGPGAGKTLAYLVPSLLAGRRAIISTHSRNLQDQLFLRDLPQVSEALGRPVKVRMLKGRANYLCRYRLALAADEPGAPDASSRADLASIRAWAEHTVSGDLAQCEGVPENAPI